jgi:hypothetical protein
MIFRLNQLRNVCYILSQKTKNVSQLHLAKFYKNFLFFYFSFPLLYMQYTAPQLISEIL